LQRPDEQQVSRWYPRLFRTALRMTGSADDAAEVTQRALLKALDRWEQFDGKCLPTTWVHSILVNCVRDWGRERAAANSRIFDPWMLTVVSQGPRVGEELERLEELACLRAEIDDLPAALRETFVAVVLDGHTYRQAAELLSVPVGTIGSRVNEARKRLQSAMRRRFPEA